jgi:formylmethanofuran dehydrogenase subunit B
MSLMSDNPGTASPGGVLRDVTCLACGCLCDDLVITLRAGKIVAAEHACELGNAWFLAVRPPEPDLEATIDGVAVGRSEAIVRSAELLRAARCPVVLGLSQTSTEAVAAALAIADRIGAAVEVGLGAGSRGALRALQRVGRVSATLGEVKNRADVVVFWGVDPLVTHPRHWERYSVAPQGRFVPEGRNGRQVIVIDSARTATADRGDAFICIAPGAQFEALWVLRALVRGVTLDPSRVASATGVELAVLTSLANQLKRARYGAFFFGSSLESGRAGTANTEAVFLLVRDLNAHTRFVAIPMGLAGNAAGAEAVLTWQSGLAGSVDFGRGSPRSLARETSAVAMLERGEADLALIVSEDLEPSLSDPARRHLGRISRIFIAPGATRASRPSAVALCSATSGIDAGGTVTRADGVTLPLRPPLAARVPTDRDWLNAIGEQLEALGTPSRP